MRIPASLSTRPLALSTAIALLALPLIAFEPAGAASPDPQTSTADCSTQAPRSGTPRPTDSSCLAPPCTAPAKTPPQPAGPRTLRHIPVPGCQLALRGDAATLQGLG